MNRTLRAAAMAFAAALPALALHAQTDPGMTSRGIKPTIERDSTFGRVASFEYNGPVSYVRIEAREPGSTPNEHPYAADPVALRAALAALQLPSEKKKDFKALLNADELDEIVAPLASALGKATAEQDVCFAVSGKHAALGFFTPRAVTTARVFRAAGKLNVIFGLVRHDWDSGFHNNGTVIAFEPGHRSGPIKYEPDVAPSEPSSAVHGPNWLVLDLDAVAAPAAAPAATPPRAGAAPAAAPAAATVVPAPAAAPATTGRLYDTTAERLRALQKLRDDGLITQQEFEQKRRDILDKL